MLLVPHPVALASGTNLIFTVYELKKTNIALHLDRSVAQRNTFTTCPPAFTLTKDSRHGDGNCEQKRCWNICFHLHFPRSTICLCVQWQKQSQILPVSHTSKKKTLWLHQQYIGNAIYTKRTDKSLKPVHNTNATKKDIQTWESELHAFSVLVTKRMSPQETCRNDPVWVQSRMKAEITDCLLFRLLPISPHCVLFVHFSSGISEGIYPQGETQERVKALSYRDDVWYGELVQVWSMNITLLFRQPPTAVCWQGKANRGGERECGEELDDLERVAERLKGASRGVSFSLGGYRGLLSLRSGQQGPRHTTDEELGIPWMVVPLGVPLMALKMCRESGRTVFTLSSTVLIWKRRAVQKGPMAFSLHTNHAC